MRISISETIYQNSYPIAMNYRHDDIFAISLHNSRIPASIIAIKLLVSYIPGQLNKKYLYQFSVRTTILCSH
ncbi:protein of unknown function [Candidatus Nitrotoga arctica]|uniref:Uncharacterized protein n=1 Tax=Candidatus Nitrotoga arctica TaxID=453162 RepID=A0ABN8AQV1_9PROT|nr:protein of unknown function [Candidatus Nitrotoga arctica]